VLPSYNSLPNTGASSSIRLRSQPDSHRNERDFIVLPIVEQLTPAPDPVEALRRFAAWPDVILFESPLQRRRLGRFSFLTADPFASFQTQRAMFGVDPFRGVRDLMNRCVAEPVPDLPPFQGGVAGLLSYELGHAFERLPRSGYDEFQLPDLLLGAYDWVIAWDHDQQRAWLISHGFPETDVARRQDRAAKRVASVKRCLESSVATAAPSQLSPAAPPAQTPPAHTPSAHTPSDAIEFPLAGHPGICSDFSRDAYLRAVERVIEYIYAGDIFQANLSQRLSAEWNASAFELYATLRDRNPAPFAGYFAHDDWAVISSSPERFVRVNDDEVETRPIKGTRQRRTVPEADLFTRDELRESEKDTAENVMIVDLLRNDLSRVCLPGTISVPQLCVVEPYETVQHLVSEIRGRLRSDETGRPDLWSLLGATFPGGSITGAPKVRAMQIIDELEPTARGPYCGSLIYAGFDGTLDSSILIRTLTLRHHRVHFPVGGGIVAQSDPVAEYEETLHKAAGMLRALKR
jgi:para-aminobenzoate synthetase component I